MEVAAFRIDKNIKKKLETLAEAYGMTVTDFLRSIVEEKVNGVVKIPGKLVDVERKLNLLLLVTGTILERFPFLYQNIRATHEALLETPLPPEVKDRLRELVVIEKEAEAQLRGILEVLIPIIRREKE